MMIMVDSIKTKGMRKFSTCFRPVDVDDEAAEKRKHKEGIAGGGTVAGGGGKESISSSLSDGSKKERSRRRLSRVLKAVLFGTSLSKKFGNKNYSGKSLSSGSNSSSKTAKVQHSMKGKASSKEFLDSEDMARSNSSGSSLFSSSIIDSSTSLSSSCTSSIASNSRSASERRKSCSIDLKQVNYNYKQASTKETAGVCYFSSNEGLCFLAGLLVLLLWGRIFAIFCTSLCFLFAPPRRFRVIPPRVNDAEMLDIDSEEYKKRVIMEGLLQRNRSRVL